ncbi:MAG: polyprenyl synthetase family protein [bacterium]
MDFLTEFDNFKEFFEPKLKAFLESKIEEYKGVNSTGKNLLDQVLKASVNSGKRLRPILAYHGFGLLGDATKSSDDLAYLGISLELFHTFCLIHDDFIDKSSLRRGQKTIHEVYKADFESVMDQNVATHLGSSAAVLGGDLAFVLAEMAYSEVQMLSPDFVKVYRQMQLEVCLGQADDTFGTGIADLSKLSEDQVLNMLDYKSGRYSIEKPLLLGAILAGVNNDQRQVLSEFGTRLGVVFQLVDDVLGIFGNNLITGKSNSSDLAEGKRTLILLRTYNESSSEEKKQILRLVGDNNLSAVNLEWFKSLVVSTGVLAGINDFCRNEVNYLKNLIKDNFTANESQGFLISLADYIILRQK